MIRSAPCGSDTDTELGHAPPGARPPCANHSSHGLLGIDSSHSHTPSLVSHPTCMYSHGLEFGHGLVKASPDDVWAQVRRNGSEMVLIFACTPEFSPCFLFLPRTPLHSFTFCLSSSFLFTYFTFQLYARNVPVVLPFENLERERNRSLASILFTCISTSFRCLAYHQSFPFSRL